MTETVKIVEFLKSGKFGNSNAINFGMNRTQLTSLLGETEYLSYTTKKSKFPSIYKYGEVEFYFEEGKDGRLHGIQIKPTIAEASLQKLKIDYGFIKKDLGFRDVELLLKSNSINYSTFKFKYDDNDDPKRIITEGNVIFIFDSEYTIQKINRFIELVSNKPEMKQISLSIPKSKYETIRREALRTGISIQNMCKRYILENIKD